jgi:hypothetical protein
MCALLLMIVGAAAQAHPRRVILYDPDIDVSTVADVVAAFNALMGSLGPDWQFEAVVQEDRFEVLMAEEQETFAFVTSAYLRTHAHAGLQPLLVPAAQGDVFYRKKLVASKVPAGGDLAGRAIAVSGVGRAHTRREAGVLRELAGMGVNDPVLFPVPKDVDALMAIHFSQVDAALVTPGALDVLRRTSPGSVAGLQELGETPGILRTPFCARGDIPQADVDAITHKLVHLADAPGGMDIMRRLAFDAMVPYNARMLM